MRKPKWLVDARDDVIAPPGDGLNILIHDIETAPEANWTWGRWKVDSLGMLRPEYMISNVMTWHGTGEYRFDAVWQQPRYRPDSPYAKPQPTHDRWVVSRLWHMYDMADVVVAHNAKKFDVPFTQGRFTYYDLPPTSQFAVIDTLEVVRKHFKFRSNSLNSLAEMLMDDHKVAHMGMATWFGAMFGDPEQQARMEKYNLKDVVLLEDLYDKLRPWLTRRKQLPVPNANDYRDRTDVGCPVPGCGGTKIVTVGVTPPSSAGLVYREWECVKCGGKFTSNYAEKSNQPTRDRIK